MSKVFAIAALGVVLALPAGSDATTREFLKCKLNDGKTLADLEQVIGEWRALVDKAGYSDYKVEILSPVHADDINIGVFYWMGTTPDYARLGAGYNWWITDADAAKMADKLNAVYTCESRASTTVIISR
jgi:hypothetical protein